MTQIHAYSLEKQARLLRRHLAEAYADGDLPRVQELSRQLDALQLILWRAQARRSAS